MNIKILKKANKLNKELAVLTDRQFGSSEESDLMLRLNALVKKIQESKHVLKPQSEHQNMVDFLKHLQAISEWSIELTDVCKQRLNSWSELLKNFEETEQPEEK